ncbi:MAG: acyl-CoA thioesterase [Proteobacteria bacterium]|nr:acyl-CoA thioesterase [Pseudomonadota bacterium]
MKVLQDNLEITENSELIKDFPQSFAIDLSVSEEDIDELGHMNNAVYVNWMDQAHLAHTIHLGITPSVFRQTQCGLVVRRSELDYLSAAFRNDVIRIGTCVGRCDGRLRLRRLFQMVRVDDDTTLLRGLIDYVCIDLEKGKPRRMPREFSEAFVPASIVRPL